MRGSDLNKAFGDTPAVFSDRLRGALQTMEEKPKMKRLTVRTALVAALIALTLLGTAYAVATIPDLQWWLTERVAEYDENQVDEIVKNVQSNIESRSTNRLVDVKIHQGVWMADGTFQITLSATLRDGAKYELHPEQNLDTDGATWPADEPLPEDDEEARYESFLWTKKGFGLPKDMMDHPDKQLLLFGEDEMTIGTSDGVALQMGGSMDMFRSDDGAVQMTLAYDLADLDPDKAAAGDQRADMIEYYGEAEADRIIAERVAKAEKMRNAVNENTDADGYLTLVLHTHEYVFTADEKGIATFDYAKPDDMGTTTFKIKIK